MLRLPTKVTVESAFQAFFAEKLTRKRLFQGMLQPIHKIFSEILTHQKF